VARLKAQLDGAWLGSFNVITDVIDKESYSNAPCIRPGAARLVIGRASLAKLIFSTLKTELIWSSEKSVDTQRATRHYIQEYGTLHVMN
jgi:hypothetical protein